MTDTKKIVYRKKETTLPKVPKKRGRRKKVEEKINIEPIINEDESNKINPNYLYVLILLVALFPLFIFLLTL